MIHVRIYMYGVNIYSKLYVHYSSYMLFCNQTFKIKHSSFLNPQVTYTFLVVLHCELLSFLTVIEPIWLGCTVSHLS